MSDPSAGCPGERPRVFFIAEASPIQGQLAAYLMMMSCKCTLATREQELEVLERESFDVILIHCTSSRLPAENAIAKLFPELSEKVLVVCSGVPHPKMSDLTRRFALRQVAEEVWPQQLWPMLQEIIQRSRSTPESIADMHIPQLVFDSFNAPAAAGLRGLRASSRQLAYRYDSTMIDVLIEPLEELGRVYVVGQVLDPNVARGENDRLEVLLVGRTATLVRTSTNQHGEFILDFELLNASGLQIRLSNGVWVSIPFGNTVWIRSRLSQADLPTTRG